MRPTLLLPLLLAAAACSGHTVTTVRFDLASLVPAANQSGSLSLTNATLYLPDDDGDNLYGNDLNGVALNLPRLDLIEAARLKVRLNLTNTGSAPASISVEAHVAPSNDNNIYDGSSDYTVLTGSVNLAPGESKSLELTALLDSNNQAQALGLIRGGAFRAGLKLSLSGDQVAYRLQEAWISASGRLFRLIPDN